MLNFSGALKQVESPVVETQISPFPLAIWSGIVAGLVEGFGHEVAQRLSAYVDSILAHPKPLALEVSTKRISGSVDQLLNFPAIPKFHLTANPIFCVAAKPRWWSDPEQNVAESQVESE